VREAEELEEDFVATEEDILLELRALGARIDQLESAVRARRAWY
jgi:hypothetical protein